MALATEMVTLDQVKDAIVRCGEAHPNFDGELHPDMQALTEVFGTLIWSKTPEVDLVMFPEHVRVAMHRWVGGVS